jgi:hypothetical protein
MVKFKTGDMIRLLAIGQVAQLVDDSIPNHYLYPKFDNAYCVKKFENGSIRWLKGKQGVLGMTPYVVDAEWELDI